MPLVQLRDFIRCQAVPVGLVLLASEFDESREAIGITGSGECLSHAFDSDAEAMAGASANETFSCSMGRGGQGVYDLYALVDAPQDPASCSEIKKAD